MKKGDVPQDKSALDKMTRELCYAQDEKGNYITTLSTGWEVKSTALDATWNDIDQRVALVRKKVLAGEVSPILYYMELRLMDLDILAAYTGFWKWRIKRHFKPRVFKTLSDRILKKYAVAFNITVKELKEVSVQ